MDRGGAETFLMKIYRSLDKKKYQMDFCVSKTTKGFYDEETKNYLIDREVEIIEKLRNLIQSNDFAFTLK